MPKPLRIFISSPGDVASERRRAALVVESLKKEFARFFDITAYLWEHEAMLASGHFQDVIEPPSQSDILVLILWSRLGTPLPEKSGKREYRGLDGRSPVTGTEWEYEDALSANKSRGNPDLLVYRSNREPQISLRDPQKKALAERQWDALEGFWQRYFQAGGVFLSAYHGFDDLEDFGDMLEAHLRQLIRARIEKGRIEAGAETRATWMQSPFRGLSAFDFQHAPIFFGRAAAQLKAVEQIVRNAGEKRAFLLVLGASGSGKSSLVRAGMLPNLFARGVADSVGLWRRAAFKPGDADGNLFLGLAKALAEGRAREGIGLEELLGPGVALEQLETALRRSIDDPGFVFAPALGRVTADARASGRIVAHESARLAIVIDQLEEIFTDAAVTTEERNTFIRLMASLARTGLVWVVATMRSDFWHKAAATPELVTLADGAGRIDLLPPSQAELAEMIRRPAAAAGLSFEDHPETKIGLDAVIAEEAARDPGSLPLVSFVLEALYKSDVETKRGSALTYSTYQALGGLKGAIATRADEILSAQPADVQAALPSVLRALVTVDSDRDQNATARMAPLAAFPAGSPRRALVDAFLNPEARLLIADGDGAEARVRVAHEALINHWTRAREQIGRDRRDLETRARLEEDEALWRAAPPDEKKERLLEGLSLEEGKDLVGKWGDELPQSLKDYIEESRKAASYRRNRRFRVLTAVAAVMAVLAVVAGFAGVIAMQKSAVAEEETKRAVTAEDDAKTSLKEAQRGTAQLVARQSYQASRNGYSELGLALAVESLRLGRQSGEIPPASIAALQNAASTDTIVSLLSSNTDALGDVDFGSDDSAIFTGGAGRLTAWNTFAGNEFAFFGDDDKKFTSAVADQAGKYIAVIYDNKTLELYDGQSYKMLGQPITFDALPIQVDIDYNGDTVVIGTDQGEILFVDPANQKILGSGGKAHANPITYSKVADNGSIAVTADSSGRAIVWNLAARTQHAAVVHGDPGVQVDSIAISPSGDQFVLTGGGFASVFSADGQKLHEFNEHDAFFYKATYTPGGDHLLCAWGKYVWDFSPKDFTEQKRLAGHSFDVSLMKISRDGSRVLTASGDNTLRLWDLSNGTLVRLFRSPKGSIRGEGISPDGEYVAGVFDDGNAVVWAVNGLYPTTNRLAGNWAISSIGWSPDGKHILSASADGTAMVFDVEAKQPEYTVKTGARETRSAVYINNGSEFITVDSDGKIKLWKSSTGTEEREIGSLPTDESPNWLVATPDNKQVLVAVFGAVRVYDIGKTNAQPVRSLNAPAIDGDGSSPLFTLAISPDGTRVAAGSFGGQVLIWDFASGRILMNKRQDKSNINSANFSPKGDRLVTASSDRTVRVWNVATGETEQLLLGHDDLVLWAAFSPDGQSIVSTGFDKTVRLWDAYTGAEVASFAGPAEPLRSAMFSPDGKTIAAAGDDKHLYVWAVPEHNYANTPTGGPIMSSALYADNSKLLSEMMAWVPLSVSKPLTPSDRRTNFLEPDPDTRPFAVSPDTCDQLAAFQSDPARLSPGIREGHVLASDAASACREALKSAPDEPRLHLQLGRALIADGKTDEGQKEVQIAIDANYAGAIYYRALLLVTKDDATSDELKTGFPLVQKAYEMGIPDAGELMAENLIDGRKSKEGEEIVKADKKAGLDMMEQAGQRGSWFASSYLGKAHEYGDLGFDKDLMEALYYYALAARQVEVEGLAESTEQRRASYLFARRASIARRLVRGEDGKPGRSADVAKVAERVAAWVSPYAPKTPAANTDGAPPAPPPPAQSTASAN